MARDDNLKYTLPETCTIDGKCVITQVNLMKIN